MLKDWRKRRMMSIHGHRTDYGTGRHDVTLLAYFFRNASECEAAWTGLECAIRETWLQCGFLKTVIVTNKVWPCMERFAEFFSCMEFQIEPKLIPGNLYSMSIDCNGRLATRFDTDYVLIVQDDGFPLRRGIDEFIGKYDFIGAPYVRPRFVPQFLARLSGCWVMNGGFSLRSHELCDFAAYCWNRTYHSLGDCKATTEDIFYTRTLPLREPTFRRLFRFPTTKEALRFSWDALVPIDKPASLPFGFHREQSFVQLESGAWQLTIQ